MGTTRFWNQPRTANRGTAGFWRSCVSFILVSCCRPRLKHGACSRLTFAGDSERLLLRLRFDFRARAFVPVEICSMDLKGRFFLSSYYSLNQVWTFKLCYIPRFIQLSFSQIELIILVYVSLSIGGFAATITRKTDELQKNNPTFLLSGC